MKKFLLLMLVLGLATTAQAGLVFTVDGEPQPEEVWLVPSQIIELDLEIGAGQTILSYTLDYLLSNAQAEFITDGATEPQYPDLTDIEFPTVFDFAGKVDIDLPQHVNITAGQFLSPAIEGPAVLMKELYIHCLDATDVILEIVAGAGTVVDGVTIPVGTVLHTLTIHQPEPMTIVLLGLGGLFALRKRK